MNIILAFVVAFSALTGQMEPTDASGVSRSMDLHGGVSLAGSADQMQVVKETVIVVPASHRKEWKCTGWQESNWGGQVRICGWE